MASISRRTNVQAAARRLLKSFNIETLPIPVDKIARHLGAKIRFSPLDDEISGTVYIEGERPIIGVNSLHNRNRKRFTIAHEIGHLVLHKSLITTHVHVDKQFLVLKRDPGTSLGVSTIEIEANKFAAELLMPTFLLLREIGDHAFDVDDELFLRKLAMHFRVSRQAMGHRLSALLEPLG